MNLNRLAIMAATLGTLIYSAQTHAQMLKQLAGRPVVVEAYAGSFDSPQRVDNLPMSPEGLAMSACFTDVTRTLVFNDKAVPNETPLFAGLDIAKVKIVLKKTEGFAEGTDNKLYMSFDGGTIPTLTVERNYRVQDGACKPWHNPFAKEDLKTLKKPKKTTIKFYHNSDNCNASYSNMTVTLYNLSPSKQNMDEVNLNACQALVATQLPIWSIRQDNGACNNIADLPAGSKEALDFCLSQIPK